MGKNKQKNTIDKDDKSWFDRNRIAWEIILLLIGVALGFFVSVTWDSNQAHIEDVATAQSIYDELNDPYNRVIEIGEYYQNNPIGIPDSPIYPEYSVFHSVKTKINRFDNELIENLTKYENALSTAEELRLIVYDANKMKNTPNETLSNYEKYLKENEAEYYVRMYQHLHYCYTQIPIIKKQLNDEFGVQ